MKPYPVMFYIEGKQAVVVGGGKVAERKVMRLLESGAVVVVVSPEVTENLRQLSVSGEIKWQNQTFSPDVLIDASVIIAATDSTEINKEVAAAAGPTQLVNVVNAPDYGNFHVPAALMRGDLTITVATNGASPRLSRRIRDEISEIYDDRYIEYLHFLDGARKQIYRNVLLDAQQRQELLEQITLQCYRESKERQEDVMQYIQNIKKSTD